MIRPSIVDITDVGHAYHEAILDALMAGDAVTPDEARFVGVSLDLLRPHPPMPVLVELNVTTTLNSDVLAGLLRGGL